MNIVVLKFGGSSVANNTNLEVVANKIIDFRKDNKKVVCIVSAQGKMTDTLIKEAKELSNLPNERELDALLNVGEQISAAKLAILLNEKGYDAISLNGAQAGIHTNSDFQKAKIESIDTTRIKQELESKIVIVTGFQGIDKEGNITTLGRGGSDTSAVAIAAVLKADKCYIFSDVDGIYTADPRKIEIAKKVNKISYKEMSYASNEGAKVLHDRCVELAEKYNLPIIAASTFSNEKGTEIAKFENEKTKVMLNEQEKTKGIVNPSAKEDNLIEQNEIKSIIKNDNIIYVKIKSNTYKTLKELINNQIKFGNFQSFKDEAHFTILKETQSKIEKIFKHMCLEYEIKNTTKISIVGIGISNNQTVLKEVYHTLDDVKENLISVDVSAYKLSFQFDKIIDTKYLDEIHRKLIK